MIPFIRFLSGWILLLWSAVSAGQTPPDSLPHHAWQLTVPGVTVTSESSPQGSPQVLTSMASQVEGAPGLVLSSLGEGMTQPIVRGLQGSRILLLERGMPLQGGRWGSDHGPVLPWQSLLPQFFATAEGTERQAFGSVTFDGIPWLPSKDTTSVLWATRIRAGDGLIGTEGRWTRRRGDAQTSIELGIQSFGDRNVPDSGFTYLTRTLPIPSGRLTNTSGTSMTGSAALRWRGRHDWEAAVSGGAIDQGLFPGFIGFPLAANVLGDGEVMRTEALPSTQAHRLAATLRSWRADGGTWLWGAQWNDRMELAPPHAHGWGPLPDDPLSFRLTEWGAFARWTRPFEDQTWRLGLETELLHATTAGWEFLLPDHRRLRIAADLRRNGDAFSFLARVEGADHRAGGHEEPLYNFNGEIVGNDVRAERLQRQFFGLSLQGEWRFDRSHLLRIHAVTRFPDPYELSANGIHHGTARFEQGNPDLRPEHQVELEAVWQSGKARRFRTWAAASPDFIFIAPTATFAPIAHAGQTMAFEQAPAFRFGADGMIRSDLGGEGFASIQGAIIAAWRLDEGTGLPLTPQPNSTATLAWRRGGVQISVDGEFRAPSLVLARNELATPGTVLAHAQASWEGKKRQGSLRVRNMFNTHFYNHINPYRVLGLAEQGRTLEFSFIQNFSR